MRISVIGTGYLGAVHAAALASARFTVVGIDTDSEKVSALARGRAVFYEPGLEQLLRRGLESGRLTFTTEIAAAADADIHFLCLGTPQRADGLAADLGQVSTALQSLVPHLHPGAIVVGKSTVPVGTAARLTQLLPAGIRAGDDVELAWNPEFLREGSAVADSLRPDRIVVGVQGERAAPALRTVYADAIAKGTPYLVTDLQTAELVKLAANAFLATKISFINAMSEVCEATGADVVTLAEALGHDARIGRRMLNAGIGYGGGCLPKDIRAFTALAGELGVSEAVGLLNEVDVINQRRRGRAVAVAREIVGGSFDGIVVTVLGAAFKPDSDDVRDSPALDIAEKIRLEGAEVRVHDPMAAANASRLHPALVVRDHLDAALSGADLVMHLTEWPEYREVDPVRARSLVRHPRVVDGRNALDHDAWRAAGWRVRGLGRSGVD